MKVPNRLSNGQVGLRITRRKERGTERPQKGLETNTFSAVLAHQEPTSLQVYGETTELSSYQGSG